MRYWDSPEGLRKRAKVSAIRRGQPAPRTLSPAYNHVVEYDERKRAEFLEVCRVYNYCCVACGSHGPLTRDHVIPTIKLGSSHQSNIQPLCRRCNERKYTRRTDYRLRPHPHCIGP